MHGVKRRVKTDDEKERERRENELRTIEKFQQLSKQANEKRRKGEKDADALKLAGNLLELNSEYYTMWNFRREIFQEFEKSKTSDEMQTIYENELRFIEKRIAFNPKSYWAWLHRVWITSRMTCDWQREVGLCNKLLSLDERNFHCWNYRRYVAKESGISLEDEFSFTTKKIEDNFSNYSSWHQRSKLLPKMYQGEDLMKALDREFELVQNAFYTEPNDQSAWLYHRWLIDQTCGSHSTSKSKEQIAILERELKVCNELLEAEPESKWAIITIVFLLMRLDGREKDISKYLNKLVEIDPDRSNYYIHLAKKVLGNDAVSSLSQAVENLKMEKTSSQIDQIQDCMSLVKILFQNRLDCYYQQLKHLDDLKKTVKGMQQEDKKSSKKNIQFLEQMKWISQYEIPNEIELEDGTVDLLGVESLNKFLEGAVSDEEKYEETVEKISSIRTALSSKTLEIDSQNALYKQ